MKKVLLFVLAVTLTGATALAAVDEKCTAAYNIANGTHPLCKDCPVMHNGEMTYCEDLQSQGGDINSLKCCWRNQIQHPVRGGNINNGGKGGESGEPSVCEKLTWPEIIHRPRCFESKQCKIYPHLKKCEDLVSSETHGRITACCWEGPQPSGIGGRGGKGGKGGKSGKGAIANKGVNTPKVVTAVKGAEETTKPVKVQPAKATSKNTK